MVRNIQRDKQASSAKKAEVEDVVTVMGGINALLSRTTSQVVLSLLQDRATMLQKETHSR